MPASLRPRGCCGRCLPLSDDPACCDAAITAIQSGIPVARIELLDEMQVRVCNAYSKAAMLERPTLFLEFHGTKAGSLSSRAALDTSRESLAARISNGRKRPKPERGYGMRHDVFWDLRSYRAGAKIVVVDVCVPISRLAECVAEPKEDIQRSGLLAPTVGHVADGKFHASVILLMDSRDVSAARAFIERVAERSSTMEGTCTGKHGIGQDKKHFMHAEHGGAAVAALRAIKQLLTPATSYIQGRSSEHLDVGLWHKIRGPPPPAFP